MSNQNDNENFDMDFFKIQKPFTYDILNIAGRNFDVVIAANETDEAKDLKLYAFHQAVTLVHRDARPTNGSIPGFQLYLSPNVRCMATMGQRFSVDATSMFLGAKIASYEKKQIDERKSQVKGGFGANRGVPHQLYDDKRKAKLNPFRWIIGSEKYQKAKSNMMATAIIVHEFGHILHEQTSPARFWEMKEGSDHRAEHLRLAMQVSQYATINRLEYVAEVFTGLIFGKRYSEKVLSLYVDAGGCPVVTEPRSKAAPISGI